MIIDNVLYNVRCTYFRTQQMQMSIVEIIITGTKTMMAPIMASSACCRLTFELLTSPTEAGPPEDDTIQSVSSPK